MSSISQSQTDLANAENIVRRVMANLSVEWARPDLAEIALDHDLFSEIDSFSVVELLLQTETEVESVTGSYIPLASESVLDADKSPLRELRRWIAYVAEAIARG
ncbi:hypothetical protein [Sphingomonas sp. dw_22]|uniref:hypothetical protein n=1 Tax=Sphingomonas sp. dw_22 TaxID=2721175 RepID=UPI001BD68670|nr:hypothetical protein [Sphingomonas sp. dw_22]